MCIMWRTYQCKMCHDKQLVQFLPRCLLIYVLLLCNKIICKYDEWPLIYADTMQINTFKDLLDMFKVYNDNWWNVYCGCRLKVDESSHLSETWESLSGSLFLCYTNIFVCYCRTLQKQNKCASALEHKVTLTELLSQDINAFLPWCR